VAAACGGDAAGAPAPAPAAATGSGPGSPTVEFWYDFASPFAYLGATQIEAVAAAAGAQLRWRPMLLGAVFRALGTPDVPLHAMPAARRAYVALELERWAGHWQVPLRFPPRFPQRTVTALRLALLAGDRIAALSHALFRAMWVDGHDLESPETLARILEAERFDRALLTAAGSEAARQELRASTEEAIARGIFGAPTFAVAPPAGSSGEARELLFWGQDRLAFVARALAGWRPRGE
jgi:2-hydroxychromene-2-carboxylate isomerase